MIPAFAGTPASVRVLVATKPVDFRKGMGGLAALVKDHLLKDRPRHSCDEVNQAARGGATRPREYGQIAPWPRRFPAMSRR